MWTKERFLNLHLVFIITGLWDIILRMMSEGKISFLGVENMKWVRTLKNYFEKHTILSAALLAGFVGALCYIRYLYIIDRFNLKLNNLESLILTLFLSGIIGIPMRYSGLFPVLNEHYYKPLGFTYSFITDSLSGVIVAITLYLINNFII